MGLTDGTLKVGGLRFITGFGKPESGISRYAFEQDVTDSWGSNDGTDNTSAGYETGTVGSYSKDFDGTDDWVNSNLNPSDYSLSEISISVWAYFYSVPTSDSNTVYALSAAFDGTNQLTFRYDDTGGGGGGGEGIGFYTFDGSVHGVKEAFVPSVDTWHHLVGTFDGSDYELYVDGSRHSTVSDSTFAIPNKKLGIGAQNDSGVQQYFDGRLDDLRIYDKALTETEVSNLYNNDSI